MEDAITERVFSLCEDVTFKFMKEKWNIVVPEVIAVTGMKSRVAWCL